MATQSYFTVRMNGVNVFYQTGTVTQATQSGTQSGTTLNTSIFAVWNADTSGASLDSNIFRVYNGDNVNDSSGNAQNGTNVGSVTFTTGKVGNAFTFNGSNYVQLPNNSLNSLTGDFSISFWMNLQGVGVDNQMPISSFYYDGANFYGFYAFISSSTLYFRIFNGSSNSAINELSTGIGPYYYNWTHFTLLRKGSTSSKIYINGSLVTSNTNTTNPVYSNSTTPSIGAAKWGGTTAYYMSNTGKIDSLTIWNKTLTDGEVVELYNAGVGTEYPFTSQTLPTPNDSVGTNHGVLTNGTTFTNGKIGRAFTFDGVNDYIALPNNSINVTGDFSISGWVYIPSGYVGGNQIYILDNISANTWYNNPNGYALSTYGNSIQFDLCNNTNTNLTLIYSYGGGGFPTNAWYHIVATRKSGVGSKIYLNGSLVASDSNTVNHTHLATVSKPCIGALDIPARGSVGYFPPANTRIDAVTLWNKELTSTEITELYNSGTGKQYPYS